MTRRPLRLDLIIRTSHRKRDGQSPTQQRQQADQCAHAGGHRIVHVHDSGRSESGKTMDRQAVRAAQQRIQQRKTDGIIVGYLDRLGRAPIEESMTFVRELVGDGGVLVAADWGPDPIDLADSNVEDMLVFRLQMNRSQWTKSAARNRLSQRNALAAGKFVGPTPLGYDRVDGKLRPHPTAGRVIRGAYRRAARDGIHAAVDYLAERIPERNWTTDSTRKLLRSRVYLGEVWIWVDGERKVREGAHKRLVEPEDHAAAQSAPRRRRANGDYALTGLVACGECGAGLVGQLQSVRDRQYRRMRCASCARCSIDAAKLETHLRDVVAAAFEDARFRMRFVPGDLDQARQQLEDARAELDAYQVATSARSAAFALGAETREQAVADAQNTYDQIASHAARTTRLPSPEQLSDPRKLALALAVLLDADVAFAVMPGRGPVGDRVKVRTRPALDRDHAAGMLVA